MRPRFALVSTLALGLAAIQAGPAHAEPPGPNAASLQVVGISSDDVIDQATALSQALRSAVRASQGWSLPDREYSLEVLSLTLGCGDVPNAACQLRIADEIRADRYVWGTLARVPGTRDVVADLRLFDREQPGGTIQLRYSDNLVEPSEEALKRLATQAIAKLTGGAPRGTLQLKAASSSGEIHVDGQFAGSLQDGGANLRLAPGEHRVEVRGDAGTESGVVTIRPNQTVQLILTPLQGEIPDAPVVVERERDWRPTAGWVSVGVGGGLVLGGILSAVRVSDLESDVGYQRYRAGFSAGQNICDEARDGRRSNVAGAASPRTVNETCDSAKTFTTLQYVFFGTGAVAIGTGAYFLLSSWLGEDSSQKTGSSGGSIAITPSFGPGAGAVDFHMTF